MNTSKVIDCGLRTALVFRGPDAVRFLNGQMTQDVRKVVDSGRCLPACVTDAKGKIQFRVWISSIGNEAIQVDAAEGAGEALEERLTKYLIADDVGVENRTGEHRLWHVLGETPAAGVSSRRWGLDGFDFWLPKDQSPSFAGDAERLEGEALEAFRIAQCVAIDGREPIVGSFPAELGFDSTDVSFYKGCYIGQEVISRIQTAKKVNRTLQQFSVDAEFPVVGLSLETADGVAAGDVTSISPIQEGGERVLMAMVKRGKEPAYVAVDGKKTPIRLLR